MSPFSSDIPEKARRVLNIIFLCLLLVLLRVWFLSVIQHDKKLEESRKPRLKMVVEPAKRATIRDRFNIPLAINKTRYRASIVYSEFRRIPSFIWTKDAEGKKIKISKRKEYINSLTQVLAKELDLDSERLEDLIHSKAALYFHLPFVIKDELSEQEYYRLKMLEREWVGIHVQSTPQRTYPFGKVGADLIGYMGAINQSEYENAIGKIKQLEKFVKDLEKGDLTTLPSGYTDIDQIKKQLKELRERSYSLTDYVGKSGVEGFFDNILRGFQGKSYFQTDAKGNYLRKLPESRTPIPGQRLILTISAELQEFAEKLLAQNESIRTAYASQVGSTNSLVTKQPWIKGGAIIAMDPNNGEILAIASYPRIDPNDFISSGQQQLIQQKKANIARWLENEEYLAQIWNQQRALEKEIYDDKREEFVDRELEMTWERFLEEILLEEMHIRDWLAHTATIKDAVLMQRAMQNCLICSGQSNPYWVMSLLFDSSPYGDPLPKDVRQAIEENIDQQKELVESQRKILEPYIQFIPSDFEKVLLIDLCRVAVNEENFSQNLLKKVGEQTLDTYKKASSAYSKVEPFVQSIIKTAFHEIYFKPWRQENGKKLLQEKRLEEKLSHHYARPYIDYLDEKENKLFKEFWSSNRSRLLLYFLLGSHQEDTPYSKLLNQWQQELTAGAHQNESWRQAYQFLQEVVGSLSQETAEDYLKTLRNFHELTRPLFGSYPGLRKKGNLRLEKHLAAAFYPKYGFGYGRSYAFRQTTPQGSIFKLVTGYAAMHKRYQQLDAEKLTYSNLNPLTITDQVHRKGGKTIVGYHTSGAPIWQNYKGGRIPSSIIKSIGKADIIKAIETSSNPYFAMLAGDVLEKPEELLDTARAFGYGEKSGIELKGEIPGKLPLDLSTNKTGLYATAIGQHSLDVTPLQTSVMLSAIANEGKVLTPQVIHLTAGNSLAQKENAIFKNSTPLKRQIFMPTLIRKTLLDGMQGAVARMQKEGLSSLSHFYRNHPEAISDYIDLKHDIVGKTSTAEWMERLLPLQKPSKFTHIWFGAISFRQEGDVYESRDQYGKPELVVVVYLRFGKYGKDAAPLAAQMVKKWREICEKNLKK